MQISETDVGGRQANLGASAGAADKRKGMKFDRTSAESTLKAT